MDEYALLIAVTNTATLFTGGAVALLSYRAFKRTKSQALQAVAVGFGFIVVGSVSGAIAHLYGGSVGLGVAIQSAFTAGGFTILLYSLYAETTTTTTVTIRRSD
ncbi:hypothetical protein RBH26_07295 [Natronolimnohabitans sp. A-GB9]|uniref:DUF7521 family protein n=1 Tax=Natronolimnohabitans sp. A-GB9 TaxID=3069757 RepID=UPI0027B00B9E|nr:hypothetical protein [Natronolimnohabitans sp. A-GB9]MDQ2050288.1 hypothetical protein [Natronolimnohabitans sp. A-GB9]